MPPAFYHRPVRTTLVDYYVLNLGSPPAAESDYADPILFRDGCILYHEGSETKEPFAINLKSSPSSIDVIANAKDNKNLIAHVLPQIKIAVGSINHNFHHGRLIFEHRVNKSELSPPEDIGFSKFRSDAANSTSDVETGFKDLDKLRPTDQCFLCLLREYGNIKETTSQKLSETIIEIRNDFDFFDVKRSFDYQNEEKFRNEVFHDCLEIQDPIDQNFIVQALKKVVELPPPEKYVIGCFISEDLPHNCNRNQSEMATNCPV